jgi:hypothetical protein
VSTSPHDAARSLEDLQPSSLMDLQHREWWVVLAVVWLACGVYGRLILTHGWIPHDAGTLGQSAERVLAGQLPHRDFDELYSGGLSFLYAAMFAMWKPSVLAMRLVLYGFFLGWIPAVYYIARRIAPRGIAVVAVLLCVVWSIPVYPAEVPSWYNLYFATFGIAALFRYLDSSRARWLVAAGVCGGLSCLAKITGLYYVAAVALFMFYREQDSSRSSTGNRGRAYSVAVTASIAAFMSILTAMARHFPDASVLIRILAPAFIVAAIVAFREWQFSYGTSAARVQTMARMCFPFLVGFLIPLLCFLVPYIASNSLGALWHGLAVVPSKLIDAARLAPGRLLDVALTVGLVLAGWRLWTVSDATRRRSYIIGLTVLLLVGALAGRLPVVYLLMWLGIESFIPLLVLLGIWRLLLRADSPHHDQQRQFLLLAVTAVCGLIQFPFSAHVYFFYVAPLAVLAAASLMNTTQQQVRSVTILVASAYALFSLLWIDSTRLYALGHAFVRDGYVSRLALPRAEIRVTRSDSIQYESLVQTLHAHAKSNYIYASPDCPEVYFLSGLRNPTRSLSDLYDDPVDRTQRILRSLDQRAVSVVALNQTPLIGPTIPQDLEEALTIRYPSHARVGKFIVRWR